METSLPIRYLDRLDLDALRGLAGAVPYQLLATDLFPRIEVWIRRDDLLDPLISGNKAYKLLFNLMDARERGIEKIITCGGAWSNHIHAVAAAGRRFGFQTVGIIRGERPRNLSATLRDAERFGMELKFVSRDLYRRRAQENFLQLVDIRYQDALFVPEGGANLAGVRGAKFLGQTIAATLPGKFDQVWLACGTATTLAGVQWGLNTAKVTGVPVLKAGASFFSQIDTWLAALGEGPGSASLCEGYECGGYAKFPDYLRQFMLNFEHQSGVPLDPVYTAKLAFALHSEIRKGKVAAGSRVLLLHSGGLQGRRGMAL
ncbi:1-aminocyclopropane-1-carboxylate deaminase/D-cysteine desulfhydrase [Microbulbifer sp. TYP-18]|uniref:1-aminocyclopropane-1-carboxylate deaminase/D-cysteine desulfhydrase n=1 Tax=Microbulbifer sp. TYP-18 TaxID=3230024 RepID=UPI0034C62C46